MIDSLTNNFDYIIFWRLILASILGGLIGLEREVHGRPAGFRTHLLVTTGACLMMVVSEWYWIKYEHLAHTSVMRLDPGRVAAQIVTGIGFIGAGVILKEGASVRGLTTAACLWVAAGIGMSVGAGLYTPALIVTAIALFNLLFLKRLGKFFSKDHYNRLIVHCYDKEDCLDKLKSLLRTKKVTILNTSLEKDFSENRVKYEFVISRTGEKASVGLVEEIHQQVNADKVILR